MIFYIYIDCTIDSWSTCQKAGSVISSECRLSDFKNIYCRYVILIPVRLGLQRVASQPHRLLSHPRNVHCAPSDRVRVGPLGPQHRSRPELVQLRLGRVDSALGAQLRVFYDSGNSRSRVWCRCFFLLIYFG